VSQEEPRSTSVLSEVFVFFLSKLKKMERYSLGLFGSKIVATPRV